MKNKKGISLIVLVITIIIIIILAGAVILNLADNNPIDNASKAVIMSDIDTFKSELAITIGSKYAKGDIQTAKVNASGDEMISYIKSLEGKKIGNTDYIEILKIENGKLVINQESDSWKLLQANEKSNIREAITGVNESAQNFLQKLAIIINENSDKKYIEERLKETGENVYIVSWKQYIIFDLNNNREYRVLSDGKIEDCGSSNLGKILKNTKTADAEQLSWDNNTSNIIGIDDNGNTVNMLRWKYTLFQKEHVDAEVGFEGTYGLNDSEALYGGNTSRTSGYLENYILNGEVISNYNEDGSIKGNVPAYISIDGGNTFSSVTSLTHTFYNCEKLIIAPEIPDTAVRLSVCFYKSENLKIAPSKLPEYVSGISYAFASCTSLENMPELGTKIEYAISTFEDCKSLKNAKTLPQNVKYISKIFCGCTNLEGNIKIDGDLSSWNECFGADAGINGEGIVISKDSKCSKEILEKIIESSPYVSME